MPKFDNKTGKYIVQLSHLQYWTIRQAIKQLVTKNELTIQSDSIVHTTFKHLLDELDEIPF